MKTQQRKGSLADYLSGNYEDKVFVFRYNKKQDTGALKTEDGRKVKGASVSIKASGTIYKDGKQQIIRFIQGEQSIFKLQQTDDKDYPKKVPYIQFDNDIKIVSGREKLLLDFMMNWDANGSKPDRDTKKPILFTLVDNAKSVSNFIANDKAMTKAKSFVWDGDWEEVCAYARVKGCDMNQTPQEVRAELIRHIDPRNPEKFLEDMKNPSMIRKHYILSAIDRGYLVKNDTNRTIAWASNPQSPIVRAPLHIDAVEEMVRASFSELGEEIYQRIKDMVSPPVKSAMLSSTPLTPTELANAVNDSVEVAPMLKETVVSDTDLDIDNYINEAVELGVVEFKEPMWYKYNGNNFKGKNTFKKAVKSDKMFLEQLKRDVRNAKDKG